MEQDAELRQYRSVCCYYNYGAQIISCENVSNLIDRFFLLCMQLVS